MNTLLSTYLHGILDDSGCTDVVFVQDNCPGPLLKAIAVEEDSPSCGSSSIPELLSRWDSSSNHATSADAEKMSPEQKRTVRSLRPPRRQISFDSDESDESDDDGFHADCIRDDKAPVPSAASPLSISISRGSSATDTLPPRPPPRRTSSRLRTFVLRSLETHMDRYPSSETDNTVRTWPPPNTRFSTRSLLCDAVNDDDVIRTTTTTTTTTATNTAAIVATNSNISKYEDTIPSKLIPPMISLDRKQSPPKNNLEQAMLDLVKKNHVPISTTTSTMMMNEEEDDMIAPPRKPTRQTTDELVNKGQEGGKNYHGGGGGESLRSLTLSLRRSKAGAVY